MAVFFAILGSNAYSCAGARSHKGACGASPPAVHRALAPVPRDRSLCRVSRARQVQPRARALGEFRDRHDVVAPAAHARFRVRSHNRRVQWMGLPGARRRHAPARSNGITAFAARRVLGARIGGRGGEGQAARGGWKYRAQQAGN
eukprot:3500689-Prymnesium_polylepis.1